jgi:hypothetical protein
MQSNYNMPSMALFSCPENSDEPMHRVVGESTDLNRSQASILPTVGPVEQDELCRDLQFFLPWEAKAEASILYPNTYDRHASVIAVSSDVVNGCSIADMDSDASGLFRPCQGAWSENTFPNMSAPQCTADTFVVNALDEARREHKQGRFATNEHVNMRQVLSSPPIDCLAFRLFNFICNYGQMPLHVMLSTFWIQYLYLRVSRISFTTMRIHDLPKSFSGKYWVPHPRTNNSQPLCGLQTSNVQLRINHSLGC